MIENRKYLEFGKNAKEASKLLKDVRDIEETGAWGVEVECVPEEILGGK